MSPQQLPNVLDRAIRVAETQRAPTAVIIPLDVQEAEYSPPTHDFKMVPSSLGYSPAATVLSEDRKSTRLNSSHVAISYAVFCLKKKSKIRLLTHSNST